MTKLRKGDLSNLNWFRDEESSDSDSSLENTEGWKKIDRKKKSEEKKKKDKFKKENKVKEIEMKASKMMGVGPIEEDTKYSTVCPTKVVQ